MAQPAQTSGEAPNPFSGFFLIAIIFAIFYFLLIRPQQKRQKQLREMVEKLKRGDRVVTSGGIHGTVTGVKEKTVILKVTENVELEISKNAIVGMAA